MNTLQYGTTTSAPPQPRATRERQRLLATLIALAAIGGGASPAFAAAWIMKPDLTLAEYEDFYANVIPDDYRPISVSVSGTGEDTRYSVIAVQDPQDLPWTRRTDRSRGEMQDDITFLAGMHGFRPVAIDATGEPPEERYTAVFVLDGLPASDWDVRIGRTEDQWDTDFDFYSGSGFRLTWVSACGSGSNAGFSGVWQKNTEGWSWKLKRHLDGN